MRQSVAGPERAENISPTGWMVENGMKFSIHSDAPVTFPVSMCEFSTTPNPRQRGLCLSGGEHICSDECIVEC
jgi:hypothetical protein